MVDFKQHKLSSNIISCLLDYAIFQNRFYANTLCIMYIFFENNVAFRKLKTNIIVSIKLFNK